MENRRIDTALRMTFYEKMLLIRRFEEKITDMSKERGRLPGMQILATGQEAVAVGVIEALLPDDVLVSNHRSHGHLLAKGADPGALMAEIMGKVTGVNKGKAGTLHLAVPEINALMTSTVVGAGPPLAIGTAFAQHYRKQPHITVVFFGDGAAAEGSVHEAMNLSAIWKLPVLFVCENNAWAGAQGVRTHCPIEDISRRASAYGMPGQTVDGNDVERVYLKASEMADHCRSGSGPALLEAKTYRMRGHGEYDQQHYVDKRELEKWTRLCPVQRMKDVLLKDDPRCESRLASLEQAVQDTVEAAVAFADDSAYPEAAEALEDLWTGS